MNLSGLSPSCCICWKSSIVFSGWPAFTYLASLLFHENLSNCTVPGANAANSASTQGGFWGSSSQRASCVFLCLKSGYFAFVYNQSKNSIRSSSTRVFFFTASCVQLSSHMDKASLQSPKKLYQRIYCACLPLHAAQGKTGDSFQITITFSCLPSHHCEGFEKNSRQSFSLWLPGTLVVGTGTLGRATGENNRQHLHQNNGLC